MKITEDFISQFGGNSSAVGNGRSLAGKSSFTALHQSEDGSLIFGQCKGSGKNPYNCSVDFSDESKPVPRCSCPSRQIPCKHVMGLLFCKLSGQQFTTAAIPEDISAKREKIQKREEKKTEGADKEQKPAAFTKAKANAAIKKCRAQLEGIELAEKILHNIMLSGLHSIDRKNERLYSEQILELGNYYIPGIQAAFSELLSAAYSARESQSFIQAAASVNYLYSLLKKAKSYTEDKIEDYEAFPQMTEKSKENMIHSSIEEQMGYAWKLSELGEKGLAAEDRPLLQLAFRRYDDEARKQYVDEGIWISIADGEIYKTFNYRPYRSAKYIREEDSFFQVLTASPLYIYPGDKNPRVRWENEIPRPAAAEDYSRLKELAEKDFSKVLKAVKAQIRSPLGDKEPIFSLMASRLVQDENGNIVCLDEGQNQVVLAPEVFGFLIERMSKEQLEGQALVCRFKQDMDKDLLCAVPIAVIGDGGVTRFYY